MTRHPLHSLGFEPIAPPLPDAGPRPAPTKDQFSSKNEGLERMKKGMRVRMADGALARVVYTDPNLRIARVRTEDGRNITVRRKTLTLVRP